MCGAGTHPGGGINGINGHNTAKKIIEDESIPLSYHSIIYELLDDVKSIAGKIRRLEILRSN